MTDPVIQAQEKLLAAALGVVGGRLVLDRQTSPAWNEYCLREAAREFVEAIEREGL